VAEIAISLELILGIIGSVTGLMGATSLIIYILRYLKEKPKIEVELIDSKHYYQRRGEKEKNYFLGFSVESLVRNTGDRGTTIGYAELDFTVAKQHHKISESQIFLHGELPARVDPNDLVIIGLSFDFPSSYEVYPKQEEISFALTLHHAHGKIVLHGTSKMIT